LENKKVLTYISVEQGVKNFLYLMLLRPPAHMARQAVVHRSQERIGIVMSIQAHIDSLAQKRSQLKEQIANESAHPMPDFVRITTLKKQNLTLKQEMQRCLIMLGKQSYHASS
jgi:hypothetical protein